MKGYVCALSNSIEGLQGVVEAGSPYDPLRTMGSHPGGFGEDGWQDEQSSRVRRAGWPTSEGWGGRCGGLCYRSRMSILQSQRWERIRRGRGYQRGGRVAGEEEGERAEGCGGVVVSWPSRVQAGEGQAVNVPAARGGLVGFVRRKGGIGARVGMRNANTNKNYAHKAREGV